MAKPGNKFWAGGWITAVVMAVTLLLAVAGGLDPLENGGYDWRVKSVRADARAPDEVAVLLIDNRSLAAMAPQLGEWPWPRSVYADLIDFLKQGGARAIVFDLLFTEDESGLADDARLVTASGTAHTVIHSLALSHQGDAALELNRPMPDTALQHALVGRDRDPSDINYYELPLPGLIKGALGLGVMNVTADYDGIYRRSQLFQSYQGHRFASLGSAPLVFADAKTMLLELREAEQLVNYYGHINSYSASDILAAAQKLAAGETAGLTVAPAQFRDKIVFIGVGAADVAEFKQTPLSVAMPEVMIHASLAGNLLNREVLHRSSVTTVVMISLLMTLLVCTMVLGAEGVVRKSVGPLLLAAFYLWLCHFTFGYNYVMAIAPVMVAMLLTFIISAGYLVIKGRASSS